MAHFSFPLTSAGGHVRFIRSFPVYVYELRISIQPSDQRMQFFWTSEDKQKSWISKSAVTKLCLTLSKASLRKPFWFSFRQGCDDVPISARWYSNISAVMFQYQHGDVPISAQPFFSIVTISLLHPCNRPLSTALRTGDTQKFELHYQQKHHSQDSFYI